MKAIKKLGRKTVSLSALAVAIMGAAGGATAMSFDIGNPDINLRWDNTLRYNLGVRMEGRIARS
ncbi:anaerobic dehydrogenase [Pseudomonas aeruginosa]|nr:anaerobic dehydrogenase [Pseudomonas aeruginosa]